MKNNKISYYNEDLTASQRKNIFDNLDSFQRNKITFLNKFYKSSLRTAKSYYSLYLNNIYEFEKIYNKDLMYFSVDEIKEIILSKFSASAGTRKTLKIFMDKYFEYGISLGEIQMNVVNLIDDKLLKSKQYLLKNELMSLDSFYDFLEDICKEVHVRNSIPYLLARYGIIGDKLEFMQYLTFKNIDKDVNEVIVYNNHGIEFGKYFVDNRFISFIEGIKPYDSYEGLVIMKSEIAKDKGIESYNSLMNKTTVVSKALGINRIPYSKICMSRKIELLLKIRSEKILTSNDFINVLEYINKKSISNSYSQVYNLIEYYETLTGDKVIRINKKKGNELAVDSDINSKEFVNNICDKLDFNCNFDNIPYITGINSKR